MRQALANLRDLLRDKDRDIPYLIATRRSIQFNPASDFELDFAVLHRVLAEDSLPRLAGQAALDHVRDTVALYQGPFLEGFFLEGCLAYDEWQLLTRERTARWLAIALKQLVVELDMTVKEYVRTVVEKDLRERGRL